LHRRALPLPFFLSALLHASLLAVAALTVGRALVAPRVTVDLVERLGPVLPRAERPGRGEEIPGALPAASGAGSAPAPAASGPTFPRHAARPSVVPVPAPRGAPASPRGRGREEPASHAGAVAVFWRDRSVSSWVDAVRAGEAPADSVLDRFPTAEETAIARAEDQINRTARRLHGAWRLEKFREAFRENFPAMR
jgi:hypothetical protein